MKRLGCLLAIFWLLALFLIPLDKSFSAPLPKTTQELKVMPDLSKFWSELWLSGGGTARRRRR